MVSKRVSEFYSELKELSSSLGKSLNKRDYAFVHWYVRTRFNERDYNNSHVTDGPDDGGIDAIVNLSSGTRTYVLQSKFCETFFKRSGKPPALSPGVYAEFDRLPVTLRDPKKFENWIETVEPSLVTPYKKLHNTCRKSPENVVWLVSTTHGRSGAGENRLHNLVPSNFHYYGDNLRLFELRKEGGELANPIILHFKEHFPVEDRKFGMTSYVLQAKARDFLDYLDDDPNFGLLAMNVRSDLGTEINSSIRRTFEDRPEELWYSHNGITMICERAYVHGKTIRLNSPNVINGAQTLHALMKASKRDRNATILVRIIEVPDLQENKKFISDVIFRTNQQNKMYIYDLRANDRFQVDIANEFTKKKVFYERRRKEYDLRKRVLKNQGITRLKSTVLAQILMACEDTLGGVSEAKRSLEDLFRDKPYKDLFGLSFQEIFFKYQLWNFVCATVFDIHRRSLTRRQRRHPLLTCLAISWECASSGISLHRWLETSYASPDRLRIANKSTVALKKAVAGIFLESWKQWQTENVKDPDLSPNNFFKSRKWNEQLLIRIVPKYRNRIQKALETALFSS